MPKKSICLLSTQPSQMTAAAIGTAMILRKVSIQGPGLGRRLAHCGKTQRSNHGIDIPSPSATKTRSASMAGCVSA